MPHDWQLIVLAEDEPVEIKLLTGKEAKQSRDRGDSQVGIIFGIILGILAIFALLMWCAWTKVRRGGNDNAYARIN